MLNNTITHTILRMPLNDYFKQNVAVVDFLFLNNIILKVSSKSLLSPRFFLYVYHEFSHLCSEAHIIHI